MPSQAMASDPVAKREPKDFGEASLRLGALLGDQDPPPYRVANPDGSAPVLLTCDHASNTIPESLGTLGIAQRDLDRHIGWDPGAREVTLRLAERFDAPAVLSGYSRLVIDCNRKPGSATSILTVSDRTPIPGNVGLAPFDVQRRVDALFKPYHGTISSKLSAMRQIGVAPVFVAIHSFTPRLGGFARPWHFGVLWDEDPRVACPLIEALRRNPGVVVGDNQPYSARDHFDFSQEFHASSQGIPSALVEVRSDLIQDEAGVTQYADLLGNALESALAQFQSICQR